ncbi:uncharacterized protein LOC101458740 [Ceratitis capitata]|uniref:uncharacterized protein LOC101458740 n=1 Tax=Ceratitis capitata TaxID=7213 RepID=UPI000329FCD2|nr:uncharacterized protein LOC101458740 [Ceratitis capitata]
MSNHNVTECRSFKGISTNERHKYAKTNKLYYRCLLHKSGETCTSNMNCKICNISTHHELLHFENVQKKSAMSTNADSTTVILATAQVRAKAANGEHILLRALIDQGSQITSISEEAAQILGVPKKKVMTKLHGLGGIVVGESKFKIKVQITPRFLSQHVKEGDAVILSSLTTAEPDQYFRFSFKKWENYTLADPLFNKTDRIDMVIGSDIFSRIIEKCIRNHNGVLAQATKFGWILSGIIKQKKPSKITSAVTNLERFWELEEEQDDKTKVEDEICLNKFEETTKQDADGQFIMEIPFKDDMELDESRKQAIARLLSTEAKLKKSEKLCNDYKEFIHEYQNLGHMINYLPHQAVIRVEKLSTKLRVVFDASAKTSNGKCLNDIMLTGPKLQRDVFDIILKWRLWKVVITADVVKMFQQIKISKKDQVYHRILWREYPSDKIEEYELATVTYGTASAPYLAARTLFEIANKCSSENKWLQKIIKEDFYMDDLMTGGDSVNQCIMIQKEIRKHLQLFGFHLRKWLSNFNNITKNITNIGENEIIQIKENEAVKTLGLYWDPKQDQFQFRINLGMPKKMTKRSILSQIAQIFDPLGWLSPITVVAKLYMQKLWIEKTGWDDQLSDDLQNEWKLFIDTVSTLEEVRIPRWIETNMVCKVEIR